MDREEFALTLANRLNDVAPPGFRAWAEGELPYLMVMVGPPRTNGGSWEGPPLTSESTLMSECESYAEAALNNLQELVVEETGRLWPEGSHPHAHAQLRNGNLWMWFGTEELPVLQLEPIELGQLD